MNVVYNPGCALSLYRPEYVERVLGILREEHAQTALHSICCRHEPQLPANTRVVNTCAGCDRRFRSLYEGITTISLWEMLAENSTYHFPDYSGLSMSIHDPCPIRSRPDVHEAVRVLLRKMNITIIETELNRTHSVCCGDDFYPHLPVEEVNRRMRERAAAMPCEDVCVTCVSCIKSMHIGGKKPRYLLDLLFERETLACTYETALWHEELQSYIDLH